MATINPLRGPIDYSTNVESAFDAALSGFKLGATVADIQAAQQKRLLEKQALEAQEAEKLKFKTKIDEYFAKPEAERDPRTLEPLLIGANKQQFDALVQVAQNTDKRRLDADKLFSSQLINAFNNQPDVGKKMLQEKIDAETDPNKKRSLQGFLQMAEIDAKKTANEIEKFGTMAYGSEWGKGLAEYRVMQRAEALAPEALRKAKADADEAVQKTANAVATAPDDVAKVAAQRKLEEEKANQEAIKTQIAEATQAEEQARIIAVAEKARSDAEKAVAEKEKAVLEAADTPERLKAEKELREAQAKKATAEAQQAAVRAKYEERERIAALEKINWDVKNLRSQINDRSQQLNLRRQEVAATVAEKLASAGAKLNEVPADTKKLINESAVAAATSKQSAGQFNDLAKRLEAEGGGFGVVSSASDYLKKIGGFQGGMTQLRQEYIRLRNTAAIKSLPPGPATDKDIALALRGFPGENARAPDLASFLRGMAKLQDIDASINNAKTDWLTNNNGSLARAKNTFIAGDYAAKAGENFNDFSTRIIDDVTKKYDPRTQSSIVDQIPTDRNPRPMTIQNNVRSAADAILRGGQ